MELIETKTTPTGTVIELYSTGKTFKTITHYPPTKREEGYTVEKKHSTLSAAEKRLARFTSIR